LRFDVEQAGSTLRLNMRGNLQYLDYRDDTFDDGFRGSFSGQARWTMLPERLEWTFEDYVSRQPIDTLSAFNPGNEQQTNVFVTGPSLFARMGEATRGQLDLRYSNSYAEDNDTFNGDRYNVAARVLHELSTSKRITGNLEATRAEFDNALLNSDYTRYDGYASYTSEFRTVDFGIDVGYSRLEFKDDARDDASAPLVRGNLDWKISPRSTLTANLSYEFADAAQDLIVNDVGPETPIIGDSGSPEVPVTPDVFRQRRLELGYQFAGERFNFQVRPYYQRIRYVDALVQDESSRGGLIQASYQLRPRLTLSLLAAQETRKFDDLSREDKDFTASLSLVNEFTRHWSGRIDLQRRERNSSIAGQDYDENAAIVSFTYRR